MIDTQKWQNYTFAKPAKIDTVPVSHVGSIIKGLNLKTISPPPTVILAERLLNILFLPCNFASCNTKIILQKLFPQSLFLSVCQKKAVKYK